MKRATNDDGEEGDLPLLPKRNKGRKKELSEEKPFGGLSDPRVLDIVKLGDRLKKGGSAELLAASALLKSNSEANSKPLNDTLEKLKGLDLDKPLTEESYIILRTTIENAVMMSLEAAVMEKNDVLKMAYTCLFFDLYHLRYKFSDVDLKFSLVKKPISERLIELGLKAAFFAALKGLIDILEEYFRSGEPGNEADFIIDFLRALYDHYVND